MCVTVHVICTKKIFKSLTFTDTIILGSYASFLLGVFYDNDNLNISTFIIFMIVLGNAMVELIHNKANAYFKTRMTEKYVVNDRTINFEEIKEGNCVKVQKEKHILFDGIVEEGIVYLDESMLNGEVKLKKKIKGDFIWSGSFNKHGCAKVKVCRIGKETSSRVT